MSRAEKWIKGCPDRPVSKVARRALRGRLRRVWHYAKLAATRAGEDIEHVHSLRVSVRRAEAALRTFNELLPPRKVRWLRERLKKLRRSAGEARDIDVLADRLEQFIDSQSERSRIVKQIRKSRKAVQKDLLRYYRRAKREEFPERARRLTRVTRWREKTDEPTFAIHARSSLLPIVDEFFAAGTAELDEIGALHGLRIRGKRLRYAMELLASAFDPSLRKDVYPVLREVQERLGAINDHDTAIRLITEWCDASPDGGSDVVQQILASEELQLADACEEFRGWWTPDRIADIRAEVMTALELPAPREVTG